jgi:hypothetical protein
VDDAIAMGNQAQHSVPEYVFRHSFDILSRMMMPNIMAASFLSDCALWLNRSIILESRHNFA